MGRQQTFDTTAVVQAARDHFWDHGYEATSLSDLEEATGLNRSSLYHAFGSKRGLFDAAAQDYLDTVIRPRLAALVAVADVTPEAASAAQAPPAAQRSQAVSALMEYFDSLARAVAALPPGSSRQGCLLVNATAGLAAHDDGARAVVEGYRIELTQALSPSPVPPAPLRTSRPTPACSRPCPSLRWCSPGSTRASPSPC